MSPSTSAAHATTDQDTHPGAASFTLVGMSATITEDPAPALAVPAPVTYLRHPLDPTPEETARRKARRRLAMVVYSPTHGGAHQARYINAEGFDAYGYDIVNSYDPAQRIIEDTRRPDDEGDRHGAPASRFTH